jgi:imidazolonepropionase-like amidohydrolase
MLQAYLNEGIRPMQVIKMATSNAAELLGWQDRIGIVKKGNLADIIAVPGDPLAHPTLLLSVQFVMKDGRVVRNDLKINEDSVK